MTEFEASPFLVDPVGEEHRLVNPSMVVGRAVECDIVVVSKRVSRQHSRLWREGRYWNLEDLESTNGTFLNGERILSVERLRDGDQIMVGDTTFTFHDPDTTTRENPLPDLDIDIAAGVVRVDRLVITLSPKEFSLLVHLYKHRGSICSKDEIGQAVWPEYQQGGIFDYQIENLVRRLRSKIEADPNNPQMLLTVRGLGYKLILRAGDE